MTSRYQKERRRGKNKKRGGFHRAPNEHAVDRKQRSELFAATFGVAAYSNIDMISSICTLLARGALISMCVVILILPAMFMIFDGVVCKTSIGFLGQKKNAAGFRERKNS